MESVIKWSGSKRSQVKDILNHFPKEIDTYYELFLGGGSIMLALLESDIKVNKIVVNDLNNDLISLWLEIKNNHIELVKKYEELWIELNKDSDGQRRKDYFNFIRKRFNEERNVVDFLFLNRTCINGLIRYNKKNGFNSTFHFSRPGINPNTLLNIFEKVNKLFNKTTIVFNNKSYLEFNDFSKNDLIYLDPPYANTKAMYYGNIDNEIFFNWLKNIKDTKYLFSFDGQRGIDDKTFEVPKEVYSQHLYLKAGVSSFDSLLNNKKTNVLESLYIK